MSGSVSYHAGLAAERTVERHYRDRGHQVRAQRWRGQGGELDLVVERGGETIFVEVKRSRSFAAAAARLSGRQLRRLVAAASEYAACLPGGQDAAMRFDLACVDGAGRVEIIENAIWA